MQQQQKRNRDQERDEALGLKAFAAGGAVARACAWPGCECEGAYRAPLARDRLREFQWFCLEHIREFNKGWDFFRGMSQAEIDAHRRADTTWHRPSWQMGTGYRPADHWRDIFNLFGEDAGEPRRPARPRTKAEEMMARLDLVEGFTLDELKRRYKTLAKMHHPDLHGGDKAAEERLKLINEAYTYLTEQRLYL